MSGERIQIALKEGHHRPASEAPLSVHSSLTFILMGKRELVAMLCLSFWCLVTVVWLFLAVTRVGLQFVAVVFPDHAHILFLMLSIFCTNVDHSTD